VLGYIVGRTVVRVNGPVTPTARGTVLSVFPTLAREERGIGIALSF
jgi:hypothetical protein